MNDDIFEQLITAAPAPPPAPPQREFNQALHRRLNNRLLVLHLAELMFKTFGYACGHFARGVLALIAYTFSGRYVVDRPDRPREAP